MTARPLAVVGLGLFFLELCAVPSSASEAQAFITINRAFDVLDSKAAPRKQFAQAAAKWGRRTVSFAGLDVTAAMLSALAATPAQEPLVRALRESWRRPVDLDDLLFFLDDVLAAKEVRNVFIPAGRARNAGILVHPDDVFGHGTPRRYAGSDAQISIEKPERPTEVEPATDGDPLGPGWTARYPNPESEEDMLAALAKLRPDFAARLRALLQQLRTQGAEVYLGSTVRRRERGYLMWGAFMLSRAKAEPEVRREVSTLDQLNTTWGLHIPIRWLHPGGWLATREQAARMAEAYDVVYATRSGAHTSDHYDGLAVDFVAVGLPRKLQLVAPDGARASFDLSAPEQTRDLSLTPELIDWVEKAFRFKKLKSDYPHWSDARE